MELESYIDRLNAMIEGLESEQLAVTNNIIKLKGEYNTAKVEYDKLVKDMEYESERYGALLMQNTRLTTQQNQDILDQIQADRTALDARDKEIQAKERYLTQKIEEIVHIKELYAQKDREFVDKSKKVDKMTVYLERREDAIEKKGKEVDILAKENIKESKRLQEIITENEAILEKRQQDYQAFKKESELHWNAYQLKIQDIERREQEIERDKGAIQSEWRALKSAKEHIKNLKQGNG